VTARGREALLPHLLPLADLVTPNIPEAEALSGVAIRRARDVREAATRLMERVRGAVFIKGGHRAGGATDWYCDGRSITALRVVRRKGPRLHGSGCILSAAIAAGLAKGLASSMRCGPRRGT
jgi:hydroxymethylpyrimidine/phosphomethylpyrimidine kinase